MDLDLDIVELVCGNGPPEGAVVRPLVAADLALLRENRGTKPPALKRISQKQHALARALASGVSVSQAAFSTGYTVSRASILQGDPMFQELIAFYKADVDRAFGDMAVEMAGLGLDAVRELAARLEEAPETVSNRELLAILEKTADRTGHGPSSTNVQINVGLADRLDAARRRVAELRRDAIDITPVEN